MSSTTRNLFLRTKPPVLFVWMLLLAASLCESRTFGAGTVYFTVEYKNASGTVYVFDRARTEIFTTFSGGSIYYTLDGSEPSLASTLYTGPFFVWTNATIRAIAYSFEFTESATNQIKIQYAIPMRLILRTSKGESVDAVYSPPPTAGFRFVSNTVVTVTPNLPAKPFLGWGGAVSTTDPTVQVKMDSNKYLEARFGYNITTVVNGSGRIVQSFANPVPEGKTLVLTAVPDPGFYLAAWGGGFGTQNPLVNPTGTSFSALFLPLPDGFSTVVGEPVGWGYITKSPPDSLVPTGTKVTLSANTLLQLPSPQVYVYSPLVLPALGCIFEGWTEAQHAQTNLEVIANSTTIVHGKFRSDEFSLRVEGAEISTPTIGLDSAIHLNSTLSNSVFYPSGRFKWRHDLVGKGPSIPVLDASGNMYLRNRTKKFWALSPQGEVLWTIAGTDQALLAPNSPPAAAIGHDGTVYAQTVDGLAAVRDGVQLWLLQRPNIQINAILPTGDLIFQDGLVWGRMKPTGQLVWSNTASVATIKMAVSDDEQIYYTTDTALRAFNSQGAYLGPYSPGNNILSAPVVAPSGYVFFTVQAQQQSELIALTPTREVIWRSLLPIRATSLRLAKGGIVYATTTNRVVGVDSQGVIQRDLKFPASALSPVLDYEGKFYVAGTSTYGAGTTTYGELIWFHLDTALETHGWPMEYQNPMRTSALPPPAVPVKLSVQLASSSEINITVTGTPGVSYQLESSSNLTQWQPIHTFNGSTTFSRVPGGDYEFYRARSAQ